MDRTAWIVVALCVIGLVVWEVYRPTQRPPSRPHAGATRAHASSPATPIMVGPSPFPTPVAEATPATREPAPSFAEKIQTLRNSDLELRLTNRGGGIKEAVLLRQIAEKDQRVVLNSNQSTPIGVIIEQPATPDLAEFTASAAPDSAVQFERTTPEQLTIRTKFRFQKSSEEKDNYVIEMNVDLENRGDKPYQSGGYFVALGSAAPIHSKDYPAFTRLVWCIERNVSVWGGAKGIDAGWFGSSGGILGVGRG